MDLFKMESKFFTEQFPVLGSENNYFFVHKYCKEMCDGDIKAELAKLDEMVFYKKAWCIITAVITEIIYRYLCRLLPPLAPHIIPYLEKIDKLAGYISSSIPLDRGMEKKEGGMLNKIKELWNKSGIRIVANKILAGGKLYLADYIFDEFTSALNQSTASTD
jgi:hypothetical protein